MVLINLLSWRREILAEASAGDSHLLRLSRRIPKNRGSASGAKMVRYGKSTIAATFENG